MKPKVPKRNRRFVIGEESTFYATAGGGEGEKCLYPTRLDTYGCGCAHDCKYCYAKALLDFRGFWKPHNPKVANLGEVRKIVSKLPRGTILRLGGMTDCFQPAERVYKATYETIRILNEYGIGYLIVTKSDMVADDDYMQIMDRDLAHIQITVTTLDDKLSTAYEKAPIPSKRVKAILKLQDAGFDVAIRLSPLIPEFMDFEKLNSLGVQRAVVEFLRANSWIKKWFPIDYQGFALTEGGYSHLPLEAKRRILDMVKIPSVTVCEDVDAHYLYWRECVNPNRDDCCNLRRKKQDGTAED